MRAYNICFLILICISHIFAVSAVSAHPAPLSKIEYSHAPPSSFLDKQVGGLHHGDRNGNLQASLPSVLQASRPAALASQHSLNSSLKDAESIHHNESEQSETTSEGSASLSNHTGGGCDANCEGDSCSSGAFQCGPSDPQGLQPVIESQPFRSPLWAEGKKLTIAKGSATEFESEEHSNLR